MPSAPRAADPAPIEAARALVAGALRVTVDEIGPEARMLELPFWDSLGQLSVILAVEKTAGLRVQDSAIFNRLTSVRGIAAFLADPPDSTRPSSP